MSKKEIKEDWSDMNVKASSTPREFEKIADRLNSLNTRLADVNNRIDAARSSISGVSGADCLDERPEPGSWIDLLHAKLADYDRSLQELEEHEKWLSTIG